MMFVRIILNDGSSHEWGMHMEAVPMVGDTLRLNYERPDEERTGDNYLDATVVKRLFHIEPDEFVFLTAHSSDSVPNGFVADSPEWPATWEEVE